MLRTSGRRQVGLDRGRHRHDPDRGRTRVPRLGVVPTQPRVTGVLVLRPEYHRREDSGTLSDDDLLDFDMKGLGGFQTAPRTLLETVACSETGLVAPPRSA